MPELVSLFVIIMFGHVYITEALFLNNCPDKLMWNLRAKNLCGARDKYMCLYDTNARKFRELCKDKPEFHRPGNIFVISGNLRYFAGRPCNGNRYEPQKWWTNGSSECQYLKSTCNQEGQVPYDNGTTTNDRKCRCDYTRYYTFVNSTRNKCYCDPIAEDCSCYRKKCNEDEVLTPDYDCVNIHAWSGIFVCSEYKQPKISDGKEVQTLCPDIEKDFSGILQQSEARIAHTVIFVVIVIFGVMTIVFTKMRMSSQENMQQIIVEAKKMGEEIQKIKDVLPKLKAKDKDTIPKNIRAKHTLEIEEWTEDQNTFVETRATRHLLAALSSYCCIIVTGPSGCGKSSNIHNAALYLRKQFGYEIIPVLSGPLDILNYNDKSKSQVFVVDDLCGKNVLNKQILKIWKDLSEQMENIFTNTENNLMKTHYFGLSKELVSKKILISCRVKVYKESKIQLFDFLSRKECNLVSPELKLQPTERLKILREYIPIDMNIKEIEVNDTFDFFPLLCRLCKRSNRKSYEEIKVIDLFKDPVNEIRRNIKHIISNNNVMLCALVLCVIFEDWFDIDWLNLKNKSKLKNKIDDITSTYFNINLSEESKIKTLVSEFKYLEGKYFRCRGTKYRILHDKIYHMVARVCGNSKKDCMIKNAPVIFIRDNFIFKSISYTHIHDDDLIELPEKEENNYFERLFSDLEQYILASTFHNKQLISEAFIDKLIGFLKSKSKSIQWLKHLDREGCNVNRDVQDTCLSFKTTPLIESAAGGYLGIVSFLIDTVKCDVNNTDGRGRTSLYRASEEGHTIIVEFLLKDDASVSGCDCKNNFPIHMACEGGHTEIARLLLQKNASIIKCNSNGESPLYVACKGGHSETVELLLSKKANVYQSNSKGMSPLYVACQGGHTDTVTSLLKYDNHVYETDQKRKVILQMACEGGYTDIVQQLLHTNTDVSMLQNDIDSLLYVVSAKGHTRIVKVLLDNQADTLFCNSDGNSVLYVACEAGHVDTVKLLLENNANVSRGNIHNETPLYIASKCGHSNITQLLLENNADVSECDDKGNSSLYVACEGGHNGTVKVLLENKANVCLCNKNENSPLFVACERGHTEIVEILLKSNANTTEFNKCGDSPLLVACRSGHINVVKLLLKNNADVSQYNFDNLSPLYVACEEGHTDTVKLLLKYNAELSQCDVYNNTPLITACRGGHLHVVKLLLENKADISTCNNDSNSPLHVACEGCHTGTVKLLLDNNADVSQCNHQGDSPMHVACRGGNSYIVDLLLKKNADVSLCNGDGKSPLYVACNEGHTDTVKIILKHNVHASQFNDNGDTPMHAACEGGHIETVKLLLENNSDVSVSNIYRNSPLHIACQKGYRDLVALLLQNNIVFSWYNSSGNTPLHLACHEGHENIVSLLLQNDADANQPNISKESPLYIACMQGHITIVDLLLTNNSLVSFRNDNGNSSLYVACARGFRDIVKLLLNNNADVHLCNDEGHFPIHVACKKGHTDIVEMLLKRNANACQRTIEGDTPLHMACEGGHNGTVTLLLEENADVSQCNNHGDSPLYVACKGGYNNIVKSLLHKNVNFSLCNEDGHSPLYVACERGHRDTVKILLENNDVASQFYSHFDSLLEVACTGRHLQVVELLNEKNKADASLCYDARNSTLHIDGKKGHKDTVNLFESNVNVSPHYVDKNSLSNMTYERGHQDISTIL